MKMNEQERKFFQTQEIRRITRHLMDGGYLQREGDGLVATETGKELLLKIVNGPATTNEERQMVVFALHHKLIEPSSLPKTTH